MSLSIVALGDSVTTGVGDAVSPGFQPGWVAHLARLVGAAKVWNLARMGARARFSRPTSVVVVLLHDPQRVLPSFSGDAGRMIARRAAAVNDEVRRLVSAEEWVIVVDISTEPGAHDLMNWHIDRMHPSPAGHRWLARVVADALAERGLVTVSECEDPVPPTPSRWIQLAWFIAAGVPSAIKRSVDLLPELVSVIVADRRQLKRDGLLEMKQGPHYAGLASGDPDRARTGDLRRDRAAR
jgi:lysophospholipase L1-like esterase